MNPVWPNDRSERSDPAVEYPGWRGVELRSPVSSVGVSHPRARVEPFWPARRVKSCDRRLGDDAVAVQDAAVQQGLGEAGQVPGGAEEARVGRHALEGEGVLVVDLAHQDPAPPRVLLGGGDPGAQGDRRAVAGLGHRQRLEDPDAGQLVEGRPAELLQDVTEQDQPEVGVDHLRRRLVVQVHLEDPLEVGLLAAQLLVERGPPQQPPGVGQELAHDDPVLRSPAEPGHERPHRGVEVEPALVDEAHRHRGGGHDLGEAGQVEDRVGGHRRERPGRTSAFRRRESERGTRRARRPAPPPGRRRRRWRPRRSRPPPRGRRLESPPRPASRWAAGAAAPPPRPTPRGRRPGARGRRRGSSPGESASPGSRRRRGGGLARPGPGRRRRRRGAVASRRSRATRGRTGRRPPPPRAGPGAPSPRCPRGPVGRRRSPPTPGGRSPSAPGPAPPGPGRAGCPRCTPSGTARSGCRSTSSTASSGTCG